MRSRQVLLFSATFSLLTLFVVWYIRQERYIYFWDFDMYHYLYRALGRRFSESPVDAVHAIVASVRADDYNMLPTLFLMPFSFVFGSGRLAYILAVTVSFAFPAIFLFTRLMDHLHRSDSRPNEEDKFLFLLIAIAVIALAPQFWLPILRGYVDVIGLNVIFLVLILYLRRDIAEHSSRHLIALGLLLSLLILLRRWYAYWVVGFFCAMAASILVSALLDRPPMTTLKRSCKNMVIVGATAVLSFFVIATPIAMNMLTTNYREVYAGYRSSDSIVFHVASLSHYFGMPFLATSILGLVLLSAQAGKRRIAFFLAVQFTTTFLLFTRTQNLGIHHDYWVSVTIFLLTAFFLCEGCAWLQTRRLKMTFASILLTASLANFLGTFHTETHDFFSPVSFALPQGQFYPLKRSDFAQVQSLLQKLDQLTRDSDGKIYILASSVVLNGTIVRNGCDIFASTLVDLERKLLATHDVDKRDGLPFQFFQAQYVVVTDPVSYHMPPEHQRVVGLLADELLKGEGLGRAYERLPFAFPLGDGSTAFIYKKNAPFQEDDLQRLSDTFVGLYPDDKEKFAITPEVRRKLSHL